MDAKTMKIIADENISLARELGDRQNSPSTLTPKLCTRIVNALLNSGNTLEAIAKPQLEALNGVHTDQPTPQPG